MSEFASEAAAAEALSAANQDSNDAPVVPAEQAPVAPVDTSTVDAGTTQDSESFTNLDLNSVPEELRPALEAKYKEFNADYTRKTQEIAPLRSALSDLGFSAEEARQVLESVRGLDDPANARQLYESLHAQFGGQDVVDNTGDDFSDLEVDPRDKQINDLSGRLERFEQAQAVNEAKTALNEAVLSVKTAHPDYKDADIERIQRLAVVHMNNGADVSKAMAQGAEDYKSWRDEVLGSYITGKGTVNAEGGTPVLGDTAHAQTPTTFANLDEANKAAMARFGSDWVN